MTDHERQQLHAIVSNSFTDLLNYFNRELITIKELNRCNSAEANKKINELIQQIKQMNAENIKNNECL